MKIRPISWREFQSVGPTVHRGRVGKFSPFFFITYDLLRSKDDTDPKRFVLSTTLDVKPNRIRVASVEEGKKLADEFFIAYVSQLVEE